MRENKLLTTVDTDIEILISQFLNQEKFEGDQKQILHLMKSQKEEMEKQIDTWNEETRKLSRTQKILSRNIFRNRQPKRIQIKRS